MAFTKTTPRTLQNNRVPTIPVTHNRTIALSTFEIPFRKAIIILLASG